MFHEHLLFLAFLHEFLGYLIYISVIVVTFPESSTHSFYFQRLSSGLELKKCQNSPLYMANSKRNIEYNLFYQLVEVAKQQYLFVHQITDFEWWAVIGELFLRFLLFLFYYAHTLRGRRHLVFPLSLHLSFC